MKKVKCEIDGKEFSSGGVLACYLKREYDMTFKDYYLKYVLKSETPPKCLCGCGEELAWNGFKFYRFIKGHHNRVHNNWGHNKKAIEKSAETRRNQYASGERKQWCTGFTKETHPGLKKLSETISNHPTRGKNISKKTKGVKKSEEHVKKITEDRKKYWADPVHREEQADRRMQLIMKNGWQITSNLESKFKLILDELKISHHSQHYVREIKALYNFYINKNLFVEVHGDFWHCKSGTKWENPQYEFQKSNLINDIKKQKWCDDNNVKLLIFWESDIHNNPEKVIEDLKRECNLL